MSFEAQDARLREGWAFSLTAMTDEYGLQDFLNGQDDVEIIGILRDNGRVHFAAGGSVPTVSAGDRVLAFRLREEPT